ncbi:hypothetical protein VPH35_072383 [Triticum aestivum]
MLAEPVLYWIRMWYPVKLPHGGSGKTLEVVVMLSGTPGTNWRERQKGNADTAFHAPSDMESRRARLRRPACSIGGAPAPRVAALELERFLPHAPCLVWRRVPPGRDDARGRPLHPQEG